MIQYFVVIFLCLCYPVIGLALVVTLSRIADEKQVKPLNAITEALIVVLWPLTLLLIFALFMFHAAFRVRKP